MIGIASMLAVSLIVNAILIVCLIVVRFAQYELARMLDVEQENYGNLARENSKNIGDVIYHRKRLAEADKRVDQYAHDVTQLRRQVERLIQTTEAQTDQLNGPLAKLQIKVTQLLEDNAIHVKRGFRLRTEGNIQVATNHLIEEAVELQAAALFDNLGAQTEEAGDLLSLLLHVLNRLEIDLDDVAIAALDKLDKVYTLDWDKVTAKTPGVTRAGRTGS